jgi:hypothetical protein
MALYEIDTPPPELAELAHLLMRATLEVQALFTTLRDRHRSAERNVRALDVRRLQREGEHVQFWAVARLWRELPSVAVARLREVLDYVAQALAACSAIAVLLDGMTLLPEDATAGLAR